MRWGVVSPKIIRRQKSGGLWRLDMEMSHRKIISAGSMRQEKVSRWILRKRWLITRWRLKVEAMRRNLICIDLEEKMVS